MDRMDQVHKNPLKVLALGVGSLIGHITITILISIHHLLPHHHHHHHKAKKENTSNKTRTRVIMTMEITHDND